MTIGGLTGWSREVLADGVVVSRPGISLCIKPDQSGLTSLPRLVSQLRQLAPWPREALAVDAPIERLLTNEGEHAALISMAGRSDRAPAHWVVAMVAGDDAFTLFEATGDSPAVRDVVVDVLQELPSAAGRGRARWPVYRAPPGWHGLRRALASVWLAPPACGCQLIVCDAVVADSPEASARDLLWPMPPADDASLEPLDDLVGELSTWDGGAAIEVADGHYQIRLLNPGGRHLETLRDLAHTLEPLPAAQLTAPVEIPEWLM